MELLLAICSQSSLASDHCMASISTSSCPLIHWLAWLHDGSPKQAAKLSRSRRTKPIWRCMVDMNLQVVATGMHLQKMLSCGSKMLKDLHHSVEGLHQTRSWNLTAWTVGAPKSGIYPKSIFPKGCFEHAAWELFSSWRLMAAAYSWQIPHDQANGHPRRWFAWNNYCRSGLQTHRGNATADTPCQSPSEFAILLPNNSIPVEPLPKHE